MTSWQQELAKELKTVAAGWSEAKDHLPFIEKLVENLEDETEFDRDQLAKFLIDHRLGHFAGGLLNYIYDERAEFENKTEEKQNDKPARKTSKKSA